MEFKGNLVVWIYPFTIKPTWGRQHEVDRYGHFKRMQRQCTPQWDEVGKCDTVLCVWKLLHWPLSHSTQHSFHSRDLELLWARKHVLCLLAKPLLYTYFLVAKSNEHSTVLINNPSTVFDVTQHSILTLSFFCFYNINVFCFFSFLASASVCPFLTLLSLEVLYCYLFI